MNALRLLPLAMLFAVSTATAGDHRYTLSPAYVAECGSCHVAYPPDLLGAANWRTIMQDLERHFGADASLDARSQREIGDFLQSRASRRNKHLADATPPRLSETAWFRKEHRGLTIPAKSTSIAQCNACHSGAERGDFGEASLNRNPR